MSSEPIENENLIEKKRRIEKMKKKKGRKKIIIVVAILLVIVVVNGVLRGKVNQVKTKFDYEEVTADIGDIEVIVEGKGTIEENSVYNIIPTITGEIIEDHIEVGQQVEKDELLYVIDSDDLSANLSSAKLGVEQATISYNNVKKQINDLNIVANANRTR